MEVPADIVEENGFEFGISFENSWRVQQGDTIYIANYERIINSKVDSVVYVDKWDGPRTNLKVYFLSK